MLDFFSWRPKALGMRILLVDSHILFREGLASLLEDYPDLEVVGQVGCAGDVLENVRDLQPDIILMEAVLSDGSGLDLIQPLCAQWPEIKVIILTNHDRDENLLSTFRSGGKGYLLKDSSIASVVASIRAVTRNEIALTRVMTGRLAANLRRIDSYFSQDHPGINSLTPREREILSLVGKNLTNQEIASMLNITVNTTKVHVHKILEKLHLQNRREAASLSRRRFVINSPSIFTPNGGEN